MSHDEVHIVADENSEARRLGEAIGRAIDEPLGNALRDAFNEYGAAFKLIEGDPHSWSTRPCQTCQAVTQIIKRPFGCLNPENRR